jgi:hypothetical protein
VRVGVDAARSCCITKAVRGSVGIAAEGGEGEQWPGLSVTGSVARRVSLQGAWVRNGITSVSCCGVCDSGSALVSPETGSGSLSEDSS